MDTLSLKSVTLMEGRDDFYSVALNYLQQPRLPFPLSAGLTRELLFALMKFNKMWTRPQLNKSTVQGFVEASESAVKVDSF